MAQAIGEQVPIYGLQPRGLDGVLVPHSTVTAAARAYVEAIRKVSPNGPYRLVGHSFGGWVVLEMALQLMAAGEIVDTVVVLDTTPPSGQHVRQRYYDRIDTIMELIGILEQVNGQSLCLTAIEFKSLSENEQLSLLLQRMISANLVHRSCKLQTIRGMLRVFAANINTGYVPSLSFLGNVILVQAKDNKERDSSQQVIDSAEQSAAWQTHVLHLTVLHVTANHMELLDRPYIDTLTQYLLQLWDKREEINT
jgi:thioesterase domain-containing protein